MTNTETSDHCSVHDFSPQEVVDLEKDLTAAEDKIEELEGDIDDLNSDLSAAEDNLSYAQDLENGDFHILVDAKRSVRAGKIDECLTLIDRVLPKDLRYG